MIHGGCLHYRGVYVQWCCLPTEAGEEMYLTAQMWRFREERVKRREPGSLVSAEFNEGWPEFKQTLMMMTHNLLVLRLLNSKAIRLFRHCNSEFLHIIFLRLQPQHSPERTDNTLCHIIVQLKSQLNRRSRILPWHRGSACLSKTTSERRKSITLANGWIQWGHVSMSEKEFSCGVSPVSGGVAMFL